MLAVKAKHATMLLTVSDVEALPEGLQEMEQDKSKKLSAQAVMVRECNIPHNVIMLNKLHVVFFKSTSYANQTSFCYF